MKLVLFYHGRVTEQSARNIETLCLDHIKKDATEVVLCISSGGGDVNGGLGLYNFLRMLPVPLHTHNYGLCGSIAATLFLAGDKRTCAPISAFSMHAASYSEGPRKGQMHENTDLISAPFRSRADWRDERISNVFGSQEDTRIMASEAQSAGLVHEVLELKLSKDDAAITVRID